MRWSRRGRGILLGIGMVAVALVEGDFGSLRSALFAIVFAIVGLGLIALMVWSAIRDLRRERLAVTPVADKPREGMGTLVRERIEREKAARQREQSL